MKCIFAVDYFKTESVDVAAEVGKAEKGKIVFFFLPEMLAVSCLHIIIFFIFHNNISHSCTKNMWINLKWHKFCFQE